MPSAARVRTLSSGLTAHACGEPMEDRRSSRARLIRAALVLIAGGGVESLTVSAVCEEAELGSAAFEKSFAGLTDCLLAVFDELECLLLRRMQQAVRGEARWESRVRAALDELLAFAEENPRLAQFMMPASPRESLILKRCERLQAQLASALEEGRPAPPPDVPAAAFGAGAVIAAAAAILHAKLSEAPVPPLRELAGPLTGMIVLPYLGADGSRAQLYADASRSSRRGS